MASKIDNYIESIAEKLRTLPLVKQQEVLDFVEFLAQKSTITQNQRKRVPNLNQGHVWMSNDFNELLADDLHSNKQ